MIGGVIFLKKHTDGYVTYLVAIIVILCITISILHNISKKKFKEAWKYICRSLELQKKKELDADGVILDHAGDIALKLGMKKEAVSYWKAALSIYSPDTNRTEIMEKIRKAEN